RKRPRTCEAVRGPYKTVETNGSAVVLRRAAVIQRFKAIRRRKCRRAGICGFASHSTLFPAISEPTTIGGKSFPLNQDQNPLAIPHLMKARVANDLSPCPLHLWHSRTTWPPRPWQPAAR